MSSLEATPVAPGSEPNRSKLETVRLSPSQILLYPFQQPLRRAYRVLKGFPAGPYRTILDLGAHKGTFTAAAIRLLQPSRIWLVEPDPDLASGLKQRFQGDPRCQVVHGAITNVSGTVQLRINRQHRGSSSILPSRREIGGTGKAAPVEQETVAVPGLTLDDLFSREKIGKVDLCKVDIEGAERLFIEGGKAALPRMHFIYLEVLFEELYEGCAQFEELHALLKERGFRLHLLSQFRRNPRGELVYANALYRNVRWQAG